MRISSALPGRKSRDWQSADDTWLRNDERYYTGHSRQAQEENPYWKSQESSKEMSVFAVHEKPIARALETAIAQNGQGVIAQLMDRVQARIGFSGFCRARDIYEAFKELDLTVTSAHIADLCLGFGMDREGRVDGAEFLDFLNDIAIEIDSVWSHRPELPHTFFQGFQETERPSPQHTTTTRDQAFRQQYWTEHSPPQRLDHAFREQFYTEKPTRCTDYTRDDFHSEDYYCQPPPVPPVEEEPRQYIPPDQTQQQELYPSHTDEPYSYRRPLFLRPKPEAKPKKYTEPSSQSIPKKKKEKPLPTEAHREWRRPPLYVPYYPEQDWGISQEEASLALEKLQSPDGIVPFMEVLNALPARCESKLRQLVSDDAFAKPRALAEALRLKLKGKKDLITPEQIRTTFGTRTTRPDFRRICKGLGYSFKTADFLFDLIDAEGNGILARKEILIFARDTNWSRTAFPPLSMTKNDQAVHYEPLIKALVVRDPPNETTRNKSTHGQRFNLVQNAANIVWSNMASRGLAGLQQLRAALAAIERRHPAGIATWDDFISILADGVRNIPPDHLSELQTALCPSSKSVDWRPFLDLVQIAAKPKLSRHTNPMKHRHHQTSAQQKTTSTAARQLLQAATSTTLTKDEPLSQAIRRVFRKADTDHDGYLSRQELVNAFDEFALESGSPLLEPPELERLFQSLDANADGRISYPEIIDFLLRHRKQALSSTTLPLQGRHHPSAGSSSAFTSFALHPNPRNRSRSSTYDLAGRLARTKVTYTSPPAHAN